MYIISDWHYGKRLRCIVKDYESALLLKNHFEKGGGKAEIDIVDSLVIPSDIKYWEHHFGFSMDKLKTK